MLVMASLLLADDLSETRTRVQQLEAAIGGAAPAAPAKPDPKLVRKLNRMAKRAEDIADGLEQP